MIGTLLEEFTDEELQLTINLDKYEHEQLQVKVATVAPTRGEEEPPQGSTTEQVATLGNEKQIRQEQEQGDSVYQHTDLDDALHEPSPQTTTEEMRDEQPTIKEHDTFIDKADDSSHSASILPILEEE